MTYTEAINYLTTEGDSWNGNDKNAIEGALSALATGTQTEKVAAMNTLNDLYWDSDQVTHQCLFGQAVYTVSYTVDPVRPFPTTRPN